MTCTNSTNDTIIIDEISSGFGAFGALVCLILGTGANLWALLTMLIRPKARKQPLSPLVFYLSMSYFFFCIFCLPLVLMRFIYRENIVQHLGKVTELMLWLGLGSNSKVPLMTILFFKLIACISDKANYRYVNFRSIT